MEAEGELSVPDETQTFQTRSIWATGSVALLLALFFVQGFLSLQQKSPTYDEYAYFGVGEYELKTHRFDVPTAGTHPPLAFYLSSLPSLHRPLDMEAWSYSQELREELGPELPLFHDYERSERLFLRNEQPGSDLDRGRMVVLSLGFALGALIFLWSRRLFGPVGGVASLVLFAFDPNLLAHARLITPDFTLTLMYFGAFFAASAGSGTRQIVCAGVFTGLALLSKHAALAMLPVLALPYLLDSGEPQALARRIRPLLKVVAIAALVFVLGYQLQPGYFVDSVRYQLDHASEGHGSYLWGQHSTTGWWYYYLFAMAIKTPLPLLILVGGSVVGGALRAVPRRELAALVLPPLALITLFSTIPGPNIGLRYVLPVYPFLIVLAGGAAALAWRKNGTRVVLALLLAFQVIGTVRAYPNYLPYFNELVGGPSRGYEFLVDSNLDWGQDLKQLAAYVDEHELGKIHLAYFGSVDPDLYGIDHEPMSLEILDRALTEEGWHGTLAVSATLLAGAYVDDDAYERLRARTPDAVIGHSIHIYRFD